MSDLERYFFQIPAKAHRLKGNRQMGIVATNILVGIGAALLGYLLGSFPTGVFIGKVFFGKDPRDYGSHNSGGTNTGRVLGKKIGLLTIIIDALKSAIALWTIWAILSFTPLKDSMTWSNGYFAAPLYYWMAALLAAFGHCHSVFLKFQGGKAVSTGVGMMVITSWLLFIGSAISFFVPLKIKKYVSLSSMIMAGTWAILLWVVSIIKLTTGFDTQLFSWDFGTNAGNSFTLPILGIEAAVIATILAIYIIFRHSANIQRIKDGTESKISWMK